VGSLDRDPAWAEQLVRWRDELGLAGRVSFLGALGQAELDRCYRRADLFVLPSRFEGYGMVCAEALAHGLPILASRVGAIGDLVPAEAGLLVPPDDPLALEGALRRLLEDPALRLQLARGARVAGARLPGWEVAVAAFAAALDDAASSPRGENGGEDGMSGGDTGGSSPRGEDGGEDGMSGGGTGGSSPRGEDGGGSWRGPRHG